MRRAAIVWLVALLGACNRSASGDDSNAPRPEPPRSADAEGGKAEGGKAEGGKAEGGEAEGGEAEGGEAEGGGKSEGGKADGGEGGKADGARTPAYQRPGDPAAGVDDFVLWGWSDDGRYYAFETYHHGSSMVSCEGEAELTIVDAQTDRYAEDGHVLVKHRQPEAEACDPPDLREELGHRRKPRLERYGISGEYAGGPLKFEGSGERWTFTPSDGGPVSVTFRVDHTTEDPYAAADGASFFLAVEQPGMSKVVVEDGRRRRPWTMNYGLDQGMVFMGPKGRHAALMVVQRMTMPEGVRTTWMSNAVTLR